MKSRTDAEFAAANKPNLASSHPRSTQTKTPPKATKAAPAKPRKTAGKAPSRPASGGAGRSGRGARQRAANAFFAIDALGLLGAALLALLLIFAPGCAADHQTDVMTHLADQAITQIIHPAVETISAETATLGAQFQGGAEAINPGYVVDVEGYLVTGFKGRAAIHADGIAARLEAATQSVGRAAPPTAAIP